MNENNVKQALGGDSGSLNGLTSGEQINYFVSLPSDINKIWNSSNKYELVATGTEQAIKMRANIKRSENPTYRMTPDNYQDNLNVVLTY